MELNKIHNLDCLQGLKLLADNSVDCCVTSPPYFGLRDYGNTKQIVMEATPELFVQQLVNVFTEVKRVLKTEGTLWLNLGDSYATSTKSAMQGKNGQRSNRSFTASGLKAKGIGGDIKSKDLIGIPWMVAFALRASGWYLRQDIIWHKPNPMPESVTDRCTKAHEYIFLMSKSPKYYYDADSIKTIVSDATAQRLAQQIENQKGNDRVPNKTNGTMKAVGPGRKPRKGVDNRSGNQGSLLGIPAVSQKKKLRPNGIVRDRLLDYDSKEKELRPNTLRGEFEKESDLPEPSDRANKKSVWTVTTKPFKEAHFATFPQDLIVDCIKAGCPEGGTILDPFMGAGTTAIVSRKLNRNFIGYELNAEYIKIAENRLKTELGLFL